MENIFENAYFGKPYKTRDGRKAIFLDSYEVVTFGKEEQCVKCIIQDEPDFLFYDTDGLNFHGGYSADENGNVEYWNTDIVSEWTTNDIDYTEMIKRAEYEYSGYTKDKKFFMKGYELGLKYALELYGK